MENATRALLIAGGVLIAILILSVGVYLYVLYSNQTQQYNEVISLTELQKFNRKFEVYIGRKDIRAQEIVSIVNLAKENSGQVQIYLGINKIEFTATNRPEDFIKDNEDEVFSCTFSENNPLYDTSGKVTKLTFMKN